jgi:hypothetical protein
VATTADGEDSKMTSGQLKKLRWSASLLLAIGAVALVADFLSPKPIETRYVIGAIALIGFSGTILFFSRNGWPPNSD